MATYEKKTWETLNLPPVTGNTNFVIFDHQSSNPGADYDGRVFEGEIVDGYGIRNLDEVLSQYVQPTPIVFATSVQQDDGSHSTFYIYYSKDDWTTWTNDVVILTYDWSYESDSRATVSNPVVNLLDYRQFFVHTIKSATPDVQTTVNVELEDTQIDSFQISGYTYYNYVRDLSQLTYPGEFSYAFSYDFLVNREFPLPGTYYTLTIGSSRYLVTNTCYRYCLYYLNQYGGWDSLLFRGKELKTNDLSRLSYKKDYVANSTDFNKVDYLTTINERWQLNTSFLNDTESSRIMNIMGSNRLYLQDLETGNIAPVNVTNSSCDLKTYKNQGRKMATYNVEVSASQPKYRM